MERPRRAKSRRWICAGAVPSDLDGAEMCFPGFILIHVTMNAALTQSLEQMYAFKGWTAAGMTKYGPTAKHSAEKPRMTPKTQMDALLSQARPRSITLVPIRPRSRGERRFLKDFLLSRRISPPPTPRFQSPPSTPFNSTPDVALNDGTTRSARCASCPTRSRGHPRGRGEGEGGRGGGREEEFGQRDERRRRGRARDDRGGDRGEESRRAAAAMAADAPEAEPSESRREAMGVSDRPEGAASIEVQEGPFKGVQKGTYTGNNTNGSVEARLLIFGTRDVGDAGRGRIRRRLI